MRRGRSIQGRGKGDAAKAAVKGKNEPKTLKEKQGYRRHSCAKAKPRRSCAKSQRLQRQEASSQQLAASIIVRL